MSEQKLKLFDDGDSVYWIAYDESDARELGAAEPEHVPGDAGMWCAKSTGKPAPRERVGDLPVADTVLYKPAEEWIDLCGRGFAGIDGEAIHSYSQLWEQQLPR